jgi:hypothetical protein
MGKVLFGVLAVFLLLGGFATPIMDGIKSWRTEDTTESFAITTGAGETTENVTLTNDLFQDDVSEVIGITSNVTGESPIATSYTTSTNVLLVSALNPSATHTLSVNYYAEAEGDVIRAVGPFLAVFIIGGLLLAIVMTAMKGR